MDIVSKITGDSLTAAEFNQIPSELEGLISSVGLTPAAGSLDQVAIAIAYMAGGGDFYTDSGSADAYVLSAIGSQERPDAYFDGMRIRFFPGNNNTGASTVNVAGLGNKNIKTGAGAGSNPTANDINITSEAEATYDSTNGVFKLVVVAAAVSFVQNNLSGLVLSNDADTDHDINVTPGQAADSTNSSFLSLTAEITKRIDAAWSAGDNSGGLFTGSVSADTTYHVFIIEKDSDASIDIGFDTSLTASNIPIGYTKFRRIGSILTNAGANIINFIQRDNDFMLTTPILDFIAVVSSTATLITLSVPSDIQVKMIANVVSQANGSHIYVSSPDQTDQAASITVSPLVSVGSDATQTAGQIEVWTNTSSQVRARTISSNTLNLATLGYMDMRGQ